MTAVTHKSETLADRAASETGIVPPALMAMMQRHLTESLTARGISTPGAGGLIVFNVVRGMLADLGMLPEPDHDPASVAEILTWRGTATVNWLRRLSAGEELSASEWEALAKYPNRLREAAAHLDSVVALYNEGNMKRAK